MKKIIAVTALGLTLIVASLTATAQTQTREELLKEIHTKRAELVALEDKFLEPSDADREANATVLAEPDTGIIRLLPRDKFDSAAYKDRAKKTLTMNGGGAYYSFVLSTHEYGRGSDISLDNGKLGVGFAGYDHGLMLNLGDISLHQLNLDHPAVRAVLEYKPATKELEIRRQQRALWQGVDLNGYVFKDGAPAKASNSYLVRSVSYDSSDIVVAFRITREDADGSLIVLFKVLKKFPIPKPERTQTADN